MKNKEMSRLISEQTWRDAKTYKAFAPHEYILLEDNRELFRALKARITCDGQDEDFTLFRTRKTYRYWYFEGKRYWAYDLVLNRCDADAPKVVNS